MCRISHPFSRFFVKKRRIGTGLADKFTDLPIHKKEILFIKLHSLRRDEMEDVFRSASVFGIAVSDYDKNGLILESVKTESENDEVLQYYKKHFFSRMEAVRGGSVAIESVSRSDR